MKTNLSQTPESARNLIEAKEYAAFEEGFRQYKINDEFSISEVLVKGGYSANDNLVSFGKLIRNNIENGNLSGLEKVGEKNGVAIYKQTREYVMVKEIFRVKLIDDWNIFWNIYQETDKILPIRMFVFCSYESKRDSNDIEFRVYIRIKDTTGTIIFEKDYYIKHQLGCCGTTQITKNNQEFPAIQSVWHGFDRAVELLREGWVVNVGEIYFIGPNIQMMRRIAGVNLKQDKYAYAYTRYIQDNFFQFLKGQLRGIEQPCYLVACDKQTLDKIMEDIRKYPVEYTY